jgi:photosynthetic reaction center H subunit
MDVLGADGQVGGKVVECWVDRAEPQIRYLEVALPEAAGGRHVLLPIQYARITTTQPFAILDSLFSRAQPGRSSADGRVQVKSILGGQFAAVPATASMDQVTKLEEERIMAYYGGGTLYAEPSRQEPYL